LLAWDLLDSCDVPGGGGMQLWRRGDEMVIRVDGRELMNTRIHGSEDALAELALTEWAAGEATPGAAPNARVLIGGLGMGFTLAAALRHLGPQARVVVAELVPAVVRWNRELVGAALLLAS